MTDLNANSADGSPAPSTTGGPSRRTAILTGGVLAAAAVTAACSSSGSNASTPPPTATGGASAEGGVGASTTVQTEDIPVGGGDILNDQKIVVTQPTAGTFNAFTAVCTHQGCTVAAIADGVIQCPCHGSQFSIVDGSVQGGPAPRPLAALPINISGTTITVG